MDVSLGGSSIASSDLPPEDRPVWIRLDGPAPTDWVEASVLGVSTLGRGPHHVRVAFREHCPYDFFKAAVSGIQGLN